MAVLSSYEQHVKDVPTVFDRLEKAGLTVKLSFLGYRVSAKGIKPNPEKVTAIKNVPTPLSS